MVFGINFKKTAILGVKIGWIDYMDHRCILPCQNNYAYASGKTELKPLYVLPNRKPVNSLGDLINSSLRNTNNSSLKNM